MTALVVLATGIALGAIVQHRIDGHRMEASFWNEARGNAGFDAANHYYDRYCEAEAECGRLAKSRDRWRNRYKRAVSS